MSVTLIKLRTQPMKKIIKMISTTLALAAATSATAKETPIILEAPFVSIASQDAYFNNLKAHCGKAYEGKLVSDSANSDSFANKKLVMHVRKCSDRELQIPFHVGNDASRTWILTKTGSGISLKHDHRQKDGSYDDATMYGGHTVDAGFAQAQFFPADQYSKEDFIRRKIPQSTHNIWEMHIYPERFTYRLVRQGKLFRVDFDLTKSITPPAAPWGYSDK